MKSLVEKFTTQLKDAIDVGEKSSFSAVNKSFSNVLIIGIGGSGIGGKIVAQLTSKQLKIPVTLCSDYTLPEFVDNKTLVIASSFSGNTEETLSSVSTAQEKGAEIACISSGGKLLEIAKENGYNHIILPAGKSPRAMLTYSLTQQFYILYNYGLIDKTFKKDLQKAILVLEENFADIKTTAHEVALGLHNKTSVLYAEANFEGVVTRMRQQINENSKALCWHHVLPEMNHNELVGWAGGKQEYAVVILRTSFDHPRTSVRMTISKEIISKYTSTIFEISAKGDSPLEQSLYLILFGDWVSVYLAELNQVDPIEVNVIDYLKGELAKIPS
ncbi:MAG: bifunctional phosphoglucose/phosphomannose isomerase [Crocinitomicaceae bacterium]|nr:bifunctional phosphoglucose/phosphomannose isomerase [Crocinitomicaceae bacterium]|tara:strand:- start:3592 stop:4581 length:990 start_codon:yes stop_codon:yes gene_type:complete